MIPIISVPPYVDVVEGNWKEHDILKRSATAPDSQGT